MESYRRDSLRRIRRNSRSLLQDLFSVPSVGKMTPIPGQSSRPAKTIQSVAGLLRRESKLLLHCPDSADYSPPADGDDIYLPVIPRKVSSLSSVKGSLSQSCPYLHQHKRRESVSSVSSLRTGGHSTKQSYLNAQREAKKSNVTVTMTYLGPGVRRTRTGSVPDELKVLQQVNGGENICVFKGLVTLGGFPLHVTNRGGPPWQNKSCHTSKMFFSRGK
ncbi:uncharacterized protein LOC133651541 isoform X2 [Entelurus aequoreus]|uniref:uncharacterized protein LOC133651541 isoform X2 n=1 Tax=Entelurus aequoreus TaxID=161455 RepID=UPI002B1D3926|nr:uncharacterized protein LOC133651541 isoform X2 [Entelurus aequoreus]